jgi:hypothetical protein
MLRSRRIAPQSDELLLRASPTMGDPRGYAASSSADLRGIRLVVVGIRLEEDDAARVLVAEERDGVVGLLLEVPEADDVAIGLDRVEDPVRARVGLEQAVGSQVLVDPEGVEGGRVEAGEEHVDDDDEVESRGSSTAATGPCSSSGSFSAEVSKLVPNISL